MKRHDNVVADIRSVLEQLGEPALKLQGYDIGGNGERLPEFNLPKDLCITLVAGYSVQLRHRIVKRWEELENAEAKPQAVALTPLDMLAQMAQHMADQAS